MKNKTKKLSTKKIVSRTKFIKFLKVETVGFNEIVRESMNTYFRNLEPLEWERPSLADDATEDISVVMTLCASEFTKPDGFFPEAGDLLADRRVVYAEGHTAVSVTITIMDKRQLLEDEDGVTFSPEEVHSRGWVAFFNKKLKLVNGVTEMPGEEMERWL